MFLLHADAAYIDVLERSLYNGVLPGLSLQGNKFFYPNPLVFDGKSDFNQGASCRKDWFDCSCCPSNLSRFIPSVAGYIYAVKEHELYVNLFMNSQTQVPLSSGTLEITQQTNYPWDGKMTLEVENEKPVEATLKIRIPGWAGNEAVPGDLYRFMVQSQGSVMLTVNGEARSVEQEKGYAVLRSRWAKGDVIELTLPMDIKQITAHPNIEDDRGKVAVQRGPLVYCAEGVDNGGKAIELKIRKDERFETNFSDELPGGITVISSKPRNKKDSRVTLVPYYAWAHRDPGEMAVWLNTDLSK